MLFRSIKVVLLGDTGTGKTTLLIRYTDKTVQSSTHPTIGVAIKTYQFQNDDQKYQIQVWDTAGQEAFKSITPLYCRNCKAAMLVYDITSKDSFQNLNSWLKVLNREGINQFVIVGNKSDLSDRREVSFNDGLRYATINSANFFETSAINNRFVDEAFANLSILAIKSANKEHSICSENGVNLNMLETQETNESINRRKCC